MPPATAVDRKDRPRLAPGALAAGVSVLLSWALAAEAGSGAGRESLRAELAAALPASCAVPAAPDEAGPAEADGDPAAEPGFASQPLLGSLSVGSPAGGLLLNAVAMPEGPLWSVRDPAEGFGTAETIAAIAAAVEAVEARFPGSPRLLIGDISRADGGRLGRHASHQSGRDADIGFYFRSGERSAFAPGNARVLDVPRTWALLRAFLTETDVERVFLDRSIQRVLYDHALAIGEDRAWLDDVFGRRARWGEAIVQHVRRHLDHMHVRFFNPLAQECARLAHSELVASGLVPARSVAVVARPGDTLSELARRYAVSVAAIRAANGIPGSALRAGRRYVIPVRRVAVAPEPLVVPPRRLPPTPEPAAPAETASGAGDAGSPYLRD